MWQRAATLLPAARARCTGAVAHCQRHAAALPGPATQPLVGNLWNLDLKGLTADLPDARLPLYEEYGPIFRVKVLNQTIVWVRDLQVVREILRSPNLTNSDAFRKAFGYFFPNAMIVLEGEAWQRVRRIAQRAIGRHQLDGVIPHILTMCDRAIEHRLLSAESVDTHRIMAELTFDAFHRFAYDKDFGALTGESRELLDACITISECISDRIRMPFPLLWRLPTAGNRRIDAAHVVVRESIARLYEERKRAFESSHSGVALLDALLLANGEEDSKERLSRDEITDQIGTFFFGAFDTTSNTLAMALNHLAQHPDIQEQLAAALAGVDLSKATTASLAELPELNRVIDETNRLTPTAQAFPRDTRQDMTIAGFHVPAGTACLLDWSAANRDPANWPGQTAEDLKRFRPDRWSESKPERLAHLPFGFGPRICIGQQIAQLEMRLIVAHLVQRLRFVPDPARPMGYGTKLAFGPLDGAWLRATRR